MASAAPAPIAAAAAASASAGASLSAHAVAGDRSVIIIGAGLAGLTVAYELVRAHAHAQSIATALPKSPAPAPALAPAAGQSGPAPAAAAGQSGSAPAAAAASAAPLRITILEARQRVGGRLLSVADTAATAAGAPPSASPSSPSTATHSPLHSPLSSFLDLGASWHWPPAHSSLVAILRALAVPSVRGADSARMGGAWRVRGGSQRVAQALWEAIQQAAPPGSVELHLGAVCSAVSASADGTQATVSTAAGASFRAATAVVVALPPRLACHSLSFRPQLSSAALRHLAAIPTWMGSSCKVAVRFDEAFWAERGLPDEQGAGAHPDDVVAEWHDASSAEEVTTATVAASPRPGPSGGGAASCTPEPVHVPLAVGLPLRTHALVGFARPGCSAATVAAQLARCYFASRFTPPLPTSFHVADWSRERFTSASERDGAGGHPHAHPDVRKDLWSDERDSDAEASGAAPATVAAAAASSSSPSPSLPLLLFAGSELAADPEAAGYMEGAVRRGQQVAAQIQRSGRWAALAPASAAP